VRVLALAFIVLAAAGGSALANDDEEIDEDGEFVAFPKRSIGLAFSGHGTRLGGRLETGFGATLELALGSNRWQYFAEGGFSTADIREQTGALPTTIDGRMLRGGLGARWLARQFRTSSVGGIELYLLSLAGLQRYYIEDNTRLTRPELAFGFGLQGRMYKRPRFAFRLDARVLFTPEDSEDRIAACQGRCMSGATTSPGFMGGIGVAW
jgi:hypothetical protein